MTSNDTTNLLFQIPFAMVGIMIFGVGVYFARGIWIPNPRLAWMGSRAPLGPLSCAGFALGLGTIGLCFVLAGFDWSDEWLSYLLLVFMVGWIAVVIGRMRDHPTMRPMNRLLHYVFFGVGVLFLANRLLEIALR